MKKIVALLSALCLLCGTSAFAVEYGPGETNATTKLQVTVDESYTVVIPATLSIPFEATETDLAVEVTALRTFSRSVGTGSGRALYVKANSNTQKLKSQNGDTISYSFGKADTNTLHFTALGTQPFSIQITKAAWDAAPAGSYTDDITFQIWIGDD